MDCGRDRTRSYLHRIAGIGAVFSKIIIRHGTSRRITSSTRAVRGLLIRAAGVQHLLVAVHESHLERCDLV